MDKDTDGFLGKVIEIAMVVPDYRVTLAELSKAGIGPWRIHTIDPSNTTDQTYRGKPASFSMKVCFAEMGDVVWEVIQPISGPSIFQEFLDRGGRGLHHVAYSCREIDFDERIDGFRRRGFEFAQGGDWNGGCRFAFFLAGPEDETCLETIAFSGDWTYPSTEERYPLLT